MPKREYRGRKVDCSAWARDRLEQQIAATPSHLVPACFLGRSGAGGRGCLFVGDSMKDDPIRDLLAWLCIFATVLVFTVGVAAGNCFTSDWWKREAVRTGHAEYVVGEGGESVWQWKELK